MHRTSCWIVLGLIACGGDAGTTSSAEAEETATSGSETEHTDPGSTDGNAESAVPTSFSIRQAGGPVRRSEDAVERQTRVEWAGNGFVLIVSDVSRNGATEVVRADIDAADLEPVYRIVVDRREELSAECVNRNIRDGTTRIFVVTLDGQEHEFRCTNSAMPAFEALAEAFDDLAITNTPAH